MRMRSLPVCLLLFIVLQQVISPVTLRGVEDWTREQAVEEIDALVVIERLKKNKPTDRLAKVGAWLKKLEATSLDLGEDAYVKAFPLYLLLKREEGPSAKPSAAIECLASHVIRYGGLPQEAGAKRSRQEVLVFEPDRGGSIHCQ